MERLLPLIHEASYHVLTCLSEGRDVDSIRQLPSELRARLPATLSRPIEGDDGLWYQVVEFGPHYRVTVCAYTLDGLSVAAHREMGKRVGRECYNILCADLIEPINLA